MTALKSSNLDGCDYDTASKTLTVHFKTGSSYSYADVPAHIHDGLCNAQSPGSYFARVIRGSYPATKL